MPILYSFRRCPFAIRARLSLLLAGIEVELREVLLRDKPRSLLSYSSKGTVPVLILGDDRVIDESLDIINWTLETASWCHNPNPDSELVTENDTSFKKRLDQYKYWERYPDKSQEEHRALAMPFLSKLEVRLTDKEFLSGDSLGFEDIAILPFIRQFANVDRNGFNEHEKVNLKRWLNRWEDSELFRNAMVKYPVWTPGDEPLCFPLHENLNRGEAQMDAFLKIVEGHDIVISQGLKQSIETAPPKNLSILLNRIFRDANIPQTSRDQIHSKIKNEALRFFGVKNGNPS